eukprot:6192693-Pleurochrysis_carterae.AAC.1
MRPERPNIALCVRACTRASMACACTSARTCVCLHVAHPLESGAPRSPRPSSGPRAPRRRRLPPSPAAAPRSPSAPREEALKASQEPLELWLAARLRNRVASVQANAALSLRN